MKKLLSVLLILVMVFSFAACGGGGSDSGMKVALVTDKGNIDDKSFNQGSWEGVIEFCEANGMEEETNYKYFKPEEYSDAGYLAAIKLAVDDWGANVVVCPGFLFEVAVYEAQTLYPDVNFLLIDGSPHTADYATYKTEANVASIMYAEEEAGYLAGYAAVKDGLTKLGFMGGMAVPAVQAFGYGYLQGAEAAAQEDGVEVTALYHYTGDFEENDKNLAMAKAMYQSGTEVIFGCGGSVGKSVFSAADHGNVGKTIGVDVDQRLDDASVITSATKGLGASVVTVLEAIQDGTFGTYGGQTTYFAAKNDGVGLPVVVSDGSSDDAFDRFEKFDKAAYDAVFAKLVDGSVDPVREIELASEDGVPTDAELTKGLSLDKVTVTVWK
ncbi:MAG: BMP family ABC transporter substrate-binding protein [Firmicutes bacterium]|nr:BMP family ABC transporter substrate-binding protein [Bacillota bacterium]